MSRYSYADIVIELVEISEDLCTNIRQQLSYYNASVYKKETSIAIKNKISELKSITSILCDDKLDDFFADYEASLLNGNLVLAQGECFFSSRTYALVGEVERYLGQMVENHAEYASSSENSKKIYNKIEKNRSKLLSFCHQGSRQWDFFSRF